LIFAFIHLGTALFQALPVAIPANELRTRADTAWIVAAAANALTRGSILAVGGTISDAKGAGSPYVSAADREHLGVVAAALGLPLDTSTTASDPPRCVSDTTARGARGYRIEGVSVRRDDRSVPAGRSGWFHYVVAFTRTCRREYERFYTGSDVRFDAVSDTVFSYKWAVGKVDQFGDPPRDREPTFIERHGTLTTWAFRVLFYGVLSFPIFGLLAGAIGERRALLRLLGVWALAGLALTFLVGVGMKLSALVVFVVPAALYVAGTRREAAPLKRSDFGRATLYLVLTYPICLGLAWIFMWSGVP
jgi:hypothetical protein